MKRLAILIAVLYLAGCASVPKPYVECGAPPSAECVAQNEQIAADNAQAEERDKNARKVGGVVLLVLLLGALGAVAAKGPSGPKYKSQTHCSYGTYSSSCTTTSNY